MRQLDAVGGSRRQTRSLYERLDTKATVFQGANRRFVAEACKIHVVKSWLMRKKSFDAHIRACILCRRPFWRLRLRRPFTTYRRLPSLPSHDDKETGV